MSDKNPQLKIFTNIPVKAVVKNFIKEGEGQYGKWYMWAVTVGGTEHVYFPGEKVHKIFEKCEQGKEVTIEKKEIEGGKTVINVSDESGPLQADGHQGYSKEASAAQEVFVESNPPKATQDVSQDNRELSIVTQSILHIDRFYDENKSFKENAERAKEEAKWFLKFINE